MKKITILLLSLMCLKMSAQITTRSGSVKPAQVEFYDLQGRLVRTQSKELESINLQGLAPGQYLMKVTMEDGKTYSDKVVKE